MAVDLHVRATAQRDELALVVTEISDALATARDDLTRRHSEPDSVATADLATDLGAAQHVDVARAKLGEVRSTEDGIRNALRSITNPADAQTFEEKLRDNLFEQAELRVELRAASERKEEAEARIAGLSSLLSDAEAEMAKSEAAVLWGKERQDHTSAMNDLLNQPPLADAVATAGDTLSSSEFSAAETRLNDLLPATLLDRAEARYGEALAVTVGSWNHAAVADQAIEGLDSTAHPTAASSAIARRSYEAAEDALTDYVQSTPVLLTQASAVLDHVVGQPNLSPGQSAALNPADDSAFLAAITAESNLAAAVAQLTDAERALADAELGVVMGDPAADPAGAQAVLDDLVNNIVNPARAAYDASALETLDGWEVEVPPDLWLAVRDFVHVRQRLTVVADSDTVTDVTAALDSAENSLGAALDVEDAAVRQRLRVRLLQIGRRSRATAVASTSPDRLVHYVRGDGPSGRTAGEL